MILKAERMRRGLLIGVSYVIASYLFWGEFMLFSESKASFHNIDYVMLSLSPFVIPWVLLYAIAAWIRDFGNAKSIWFVARFFILWVFSNLATQLIRQLILRKKTLKR